MTVIAATPVTVSPAGPPGKGWIFDHGAPGAGVGRVGDMYLNVDTFEAYGPKLSGATWAGAAIVNLQSAADEANDARDAALAAADAANDNAEASAASATSAWVAMYATLHAHDEALPAATAAAASAATATTQAGVATTQAGIATTKAGEAATSAAAALTSKNAAATSETNAGNSATAAGSSATAAAGSATSASGSATAAGNSATAAATSATNAGNNATAAAGSAAAAAATAASLGAIGTAAFAALDTDTALAANSDTRVASQKAVKAYIDQIVAAQDAMVFKGAIDCSANPNYPAADRGWTYRVSVAGKIGGASGVNVEVGDLLMCLTDGTASGNQATVGSAWNISQANIDGAVIGPASSASGNIATFNGTGGKVLQDGGKALPSGAIVGTTDVQTLTNKTLAAPTTTGKLTTAASATGGAGLNLPAGAAPTSPADGDMWLTTAGLYARISGATVGPFVAVVKAAGSDIRVGTDDAKFATSKAIRDAMAFAALADAATIAVDMGAGFNFSVTLGGNRTLGAPTNSIAGQSGLILVTQDGTGSRTLAYNSAWKFAGGTPTASTAAGAVDAIAYTVSTGGGSPVIRATYIKAFA